MARSAAMLHCLLTVAAAAALGGAVVFIAWVKGYDNTSALQTTDLALSCTDAQSWLERRCSQQDCTVSCRGDPVTSARAPRDVDGGPPRETEVTQADPSVHPQLALGASPTWQVTPQAGNDEGSQKKDAVPCAVKMVYHPSPWESHWRANIEKVAEETKEWSRGCELMKSASGSVGQWLDLWRKRERWTREAAVAAQWSREVFSYHAVIDTCTGATLAELPLEPLVGFLRHPLYVCTDDSSKFRSSKDYMFVAWSFEVYPRHMPRALFFDLGASLYNKGRGGASQQWFVETFSARGIKFDRILAWEAEAYEQTRIFGAMPDSVVDIVSYFNLPADPTRDAKHNPLRTLNAVARPDDFVAFKLDIDNSAAERLLIDQILGDESILRLIDEFFLEHHVHRSPMVRRGWGKGLAREGSTEKIMDSYDIFSKLRERGIRAHSWV